MEIVKTKLAHYVLPAFPFLAFITADMLVRAISGQINDLRRTATVVAMGIWALVVIGLAFAPWVARRQFEVPLFATLLFTVAGVAYAASVFGMVLKKKISAMGFAMGAGMMLVIFILYAMYLPAAQFLRMPQRIASVLNENGANTKGDVIMVDYDEDSLSYYQGGTIRQGAPDYFQRVSPEQWARWTVVT